MRRCPILDVRNELAKPVESPGRKQISIRKHAAFFGVIGDNDSTLCADVFYRQQLPFVLYGRASKKAYRKGLWEEI